jgi:poly-gamma-glutamate synthesis protein (capsule biosynthesis protein)
MTLMHPTRHDSSPGNLRRALTTLILVLSLAAGFSPIHAAAPRQITALAPTPTPEIGQVTLALLGDINLGRGVYPNKDTFAYLKPILEAADLAMANLESPLTTKPVVTKSPYALCTDPEKAEFLSEAGFDVLSVANNHYIDCGLSGYKETLATIKQNGMDAIPADFVTVYRELNGVKLAFLAVNATWAFDQLALLKAISSARALGAVVVVSVHWGDEYFAQPNKFQKTLAKEMAEAGASLIWGHHPHVLQPIEWIDIPCDSQDAAKICRQTLVFYSLGNALFDQYGLPDTRRSALMLVELSKNGVQQFHAIPFVIDEPRSRLVAADDETAKKILERLRPK